MLEMSQQDYLEEQLHEFIKTFNSIQANRMNLDEQIAQVLKEADFVNIYRTIKEGNLDDATAEQRQRGTDQRTAVQSLIEKINRHDSIVLQWMPMEI